MSRSIMQSIVLVLPLVWTMSVGPCFSQVRCGAIGGIVTDPSGAMVVHADISVAGGEKTVRSTHSEKTGEYSVRGLLPGVYTVTARANNFAEFRRDEIQILAGQTTKLNVSFAMGTLRQQVTVSNETMKIGVGPDVNA